MRPLRLRARNFRTFPTLDLEFGSGVIGILGELRDAPEGADSNGAGKSSILEAVDIVLFGRRSLAGYLTRGGDADEVMVELVFSHNAATYRVRRTYSPKGRGVTKVDLERMAVAQEEDGVDYAMRAPMTFETLTQATGRETDALLQDIIGLSQQTFRDSAYLRQGDGGYADPDRDPKQRKELLVEAVLGRDPVWPKLAETARLRRRQGENDTALLTADLARLQEIAAGKDVCEQDVAASAVIVRDATERLADAENKYRAAEQEAQAVRERAALRAAAQAELERATAAFDAVAERARKATQAKTDTVATLVEIAALATPEQLADLERRFTEFRDADAANTVAVAGHARAIADRDAAVRQRDLLAHTIADAQARSLELRATATGVLNAAEGSEACDRCGQTLGAEAAGAAAASYRREAVEFENKAVALTAELELIVVPDVGEPPDLPFDASDAYAVASQLDLARGQQQTRAALNERVTNLAAIADDAPQTVDRDLAHNAVQSARLQLTAIPPDGPVADPDALASLVATCRAARDTAIAAEATARGTLATALQAERDVHIVTQQLAGARATIDRDALLEKAYGRDGIPALIIENTAIPSIEAEASRILRALGTGFDVQLRTQAETKAGTLRDTLDVVVIDEDGNEADYADGTSGGEQTRIGLALRIALARLLAARRGAESRLLALDEPSYLDAAGMTALLEVLRGLDSEFDLILLVSHVAELRDALDETITVVKSGSVSSIAGALVEAVAA
jgi:DNA repair exonuclease SbcCD ATPase subunit